MDSVTLIFSIAILLAGILIFELFWYMNKTPGFDKFYIYLLTMFLLFLIVAYIIVYIIQQNNCRICCGA